MPPAKKYNFTEGEVLLIDKPSTWTSFDVVNKIRYMIRDYTGIRKIKVGHAGTLDPLATGLLIVCVGKATRRILEFSGLDKEYTGTLYLGATTPSYDKETEVDRVFDTTHLSPEAIVDAARAFVGIIRQVPPAYSAIKVEGVRSYKRAREREKVELPPREVQVHAFEITHPGIPESDFRVLCSKGTYIRSLIHDLGKALHSGAYILSLRRTRIGEFSLGEALTIGELEQTLRGEA